jgi:hypothetical protein
MLHLEALACLAAFFILLAFFFQASQSLYASSQESLDFFEAGLLAESHAFYVDGVYNNTSSQSLNRQMRKPSGHFDPRFKGEGQWPLPVKAGFSALTCCSPFWPPAS